MAGLYFNPKPRASGRGAILTLLTVYMKSVLARNSRSPQASLAAFLFDVDGIGGSVEISKLKRRSIPF